MTPATKLLKKAKIEHQVLEYHHDPKAQAYGLEAAEKLGLDQKEVFKTLVVQVDEKELVVGIIPVAEQLSMKLIAKAVKGKKAKMADPAVVQKTTGYVLGGVSPLGQKKRLKTVIDITAEYLETIYVSGGKRGLDIGLAPKDLQQVLNAQFLDIKAE
ncbi:Cys-tRNA(Pro) deacylase [Aliivibrio fischeri]|uniref:Cys-tRNA(Pro) deacylase n=1 Tax=Aliivibrio fischeri TaxID=668 RepID=UPI0012D8813E|nr:Cys-tRNA(Pro) deacylase [Aliivibrio fischeri]MCE4934847.1 Cys-tRNA(Pro) deacylase [Aliivibrio fischeri]MUH97936.1 Cys-tRNA(Pro) deacylase [Aliivibrio fischeri]MUI63385.1 Cys-tRNA(Pro) deacylase [Aliivibrio fischeri]USR94775.1 Cys-tRNA(Pro) deacylase [Aliivibrio fischeri ATCC 7744 = JCM 18803 = DSM 507]GGK41469.1 Cys-tRNA(Pro)/Cys-tRNA(Cys) deacylase [Aliivibrio fischeri]